MNVSPDKTPDSGYMGSARRGASLGRSTFDLRDPETVAELRRDIEYTAGTLASLKAGVFAANFDSPAAMAAHIAKIEARQARDVAQLVAIETAPAVIRLHLRRVHLDSGGYDSGGAYWGHGAPLYVAYDDADLFNEYVRGRNREAVQAEILADNPGVTFYRSRWDSESVH